MEHRSCQQGLNTSQPWSQVHLWQEEEAAVAVRGCAKTVDPQALTVALSPAGLGAEPEVRPGLSPAASPSPPTSLSQPLGLCFQGEQISPS